MKFSPDIYDQPPEKNAAAIFIPIDDFTGCWMNRRTEACTFPHCIQMPGGTVNPGETIFAGALRELKEETGFVALPRELKPIGLINVGLIQYRPYYMHWFCLLTEQPFTPKNMEPDKHDAWRVFTFEEMLKDNLIPGNYTAIRHLEWWLDRLKSKG